MRTRSLFSILLLTVSALCHAIPAARVSRTVVQPDGSVLTVITAGDEFAHYHITQDGKMVAPDTYGEWKYVSTILDGRIMDGRITAHDPEYRTSAENSYVSSIDQNHLVDKLRSARRDMRPLDMISTKGTVSASRAPGRYSYSSISPFGTIHGLIVLVDFPDRKFMHEDSLTLRQFQRMYNEEGYNGTAEYKGQKLTATGSVRDYFISQSFGQFTPEFDVIGPITAKNGYAYYGKNDSKGYDNYSARKLVDEILDYIYSNKLVDLSAYDSDDNRELDFMGIIYAGHGENYVGDTDPDCIWPHQWGISKRLGNIQTINYFMTCELLYETDNVYDGIGCFCHEFSHALGIPDFYDSGGSAVLGAWSIMDYGSYNNYGYSPTGYLAFERYSMSWMDLDPIESPGNYTLDQLERSGHAFCFTTDTPDQFIILENKSNSGWNAGLPGSGLLVTSVSYNRTDWFNNDPNSTTKKGFAIIPADGNVEDKAQKSDLFPYGTMDSITMYSSPALKIYNGPYINMAVRDITRKNNGQVVFTVGNYTTGITSATQSQTATIRQSDGQITVQSTAGTAISVHTLSGVMVYSKISDGTDTRIQLPAKGTWIIRYGNKTEKVQY